MPNAAATNNAACPNCDNTTCICRSCSNCNGRFHPDNFCNQDPSCGRCTYEGCCTHWYCCGCERIHDSSVNHCNRCDLCPEKCACVQCPGCDDTFSSVCEDCRYCEGCCRCHPANNGISFIRPNAPTFHNAKKDEFKLNASKRHISVEIEVAAVRQSGFQVVDTVKKWKGGLVEDGSLPSTGFEINTAPANGDLFVKQIDEICNALKDQNGKVTKECGLHVHINAQDYDFIALRKLAVLYDKTEDALFSIVAPSRKQSHYCRPCGKKYVKDIEAHRMPKASEKRMIKNIYGENTETLEHVKGNKYNEARYNALNFHSWVYRGSIECRMHAGTINADKIKNWGMLWAAILDFAYDHSEKEIKALKGDSLSVLLSIAPTKEVRNWVIERYKTFKDTANPQADDRGEV